MCAISERAIIFALDQSPTLAVKETAVEYWLSQSSIAPLTSKAPQLNFCV
jgi:hypothetical protein